MLNPSKLSFRGFIFVIVAALMTAGASGEGVRDPWSGMNRGVYHFNDRLDRWILQPVSQGYVAAVPAALRSNVHNFFSNLGDTLVVLNDVLQAHPSAAYHDGLRLIVNTTFGLAGFFDRATPIGLVKHEQDFGLTLGRWGVPDGPYVVLPFVGPSSLRDAPASVVDLLLYPLSFVRPSRDQWGPDVLYVIDKRAQLLPFQATLDSSGDPYSLMREVYLQRRDAAVRVDQGKTNASSDEDPFTSE